MNISPPATSPLDSLKTMIIQRNLPTQLPLLNFRSAHDTYSSLPTTNYPKRPSLTVNREISAEYLKCKLNSEVLMG